ncbi:MAG: GNAT family N-acetyltransferase [Cyclobacteriaceae bacterium]
MSNIEYRPFNPEDLKPLHEAFLKSFENYFTTFQPTLEQFEHRIFNKLKISCDFSELAWVGDQVVGFVLHSSGKYRGKSTLYNGGTGVIPAFRRKQIAQKLYENILRRCAQDGHFEQLVLEVIDKNTQALRLYESLGFQFGRELKCFVLREIPLKCNDDFFWRESRAYKPEAYAQLLSYSPSFMDAWPHLSHSLVGETILEAYSSQGLQGFAVFNPTVGRISQLGIGKENLNSALANALIAKIQSLCQKELNIINISSEELELISLLESIGWVNELNQFEMELAF